MNPTSGNPAIQTAEIDARHQLQQMSGALPADEIDTLSRDNSSAGIDETKILQDDYFQLSRRSPETSLEALERTNHVAQISRKTSLEVLKHASHVGQISADSNILIRGNNDPLRETASTISVEGPSNIPLPSTSSDNVSTLHPSLISLPPSSIEPSESSENEKLIDSFYLYKENSFRLSGHFPHLRSVCSGSRHDKANITIFDYANSTLRDRRHLSIDLIPKNRAQSQDVACSKLDECHHFICSIDLSSQVDTRLVVVEDLGPSLINLLGSTFDLSPEFFEEHLYRSDYRGFRVSGPSPSTWRTSNLQKTYVSFAWSRPGESWRLEIEPGQWEDLLRHDTPRVETVTETYKDGLLREVSHRFVANTNIFRRSSELSTNPAGHLPDRMPCGWEERATVCSVEFDGLQYGAC